MGSGNYIPLYDGESKQNLTQGNVRIIWKELGLSILNFTGIKANLTTTTEDSIATILESLNMSSLLSNLNNSQSMMEFEKYIISITTDANYKATPEYSDAFVAFDVDEPISKNATSSDSSASNSPAKNEFSFKAPYDKLALNTQQVADPGKQDENDDDEKLIGPADDGFFSNLYGFIFKDDDDDVRPATESPTKAPAEATESPPVSPSIAMIGKKNEPAPHIQNNTLPLSLIGILHNSKKDNPDKSPIPQRKNNKVIDPTDEPLNEKTSLPPITTALPFEIPKNLTDRTENLSILRDVLIATLNHQSSIDRSDDFSQQSPIFLHRPINNISPAYLSGTAFPSLPASNSIESKHSFQRNPIRSELDLIIPELNKNQASNDIGHNNFSPGSYHVLPSEPADTGHTESHVINPVDLSKLKVHQSVGSETKVFTPPSKDPAGILKLAGCNIYGRMYRVGQIIDELSRACLECRCSEVGVSCSPVNC